MTASLLKLLRCAGGARESIVNQPVSKILIVCAIGLVGVVASTDDAAAARCGDSRLGAGCVTSRGAIGVDRYGAVAVGRGGNVYTYRRGSACYWRNNRRICP